MFNSLATPRFKFSLILLSAGAFICSSASADSFVVTVEAPKIQSANVTALCGNLGSGTCTVGVESFDSRTSGQAFTTTYGTGGTITGKYSSVQVNSADVFGGAGGVGKYAAAGGSTPYSVSLSTTLSTGINYFGFWLSALDTGNQVSFFNAGVQVYQFTPADLVAQLGSCTSTNLYCTNPNAPFLGQNNQQYAFVNFFDRTGTFDQITFTENPAVGGYESDNHTVGYVTNMTGTPVGATPEPATLSLVATGLAAALARRRLVKNKK